MPTSLDRIQCLMGPDTYASVLTLCNITGKTKSNMAAELIEASIKNPKYRALLQEASDELVVTPKEDPRTEARNKTTHRQPSAKLKQEIKAKSSGNPHERLAARIKEEADAGRFHPDMPDMVVVDGGAYASDLTAEDLATSAARQSMVDATHVQPIRKTPEQQAKILELFKAGAISQEDVNRLMSPQVPDQGQPRQEKEVDMRDDLLKTVGEQDSRLKKMEEMMKALEMLKA